MNHGEQGHHERYHRDQDPDQAQPVGDPYGCVVGVPERPQFLEGRGAPDCQRHTGFEVVYAERIAGIVIQRDRFPVEPVCGIPADNATHDPFAVTHIDPVRGKPRRSGRGRIARTA